LSLLCPIATCKSISRFDIFSHHPDFEWVTSDVMKMYFGSRSWPLGGDSFSIGCHFRSQILAAPCSGDDITLWVAMLPRWVAMWSQEALQVCQYLASFGNHNENNVSALRIFTVHHYWKTWDTFYNILIPRSTSCLPSQVPYLHDFVICNGFSFFTSHMDIASHLGAIRSHYSNHLAVKYWNSSWAKVLFHAYIHSFLSTCPQ
jgi:hypothetical protein